jgi:hypothetical protein
VAADISAIRVDQVTAGMTVRVLLPSSAESSLKAFSPLTEGLFRVEPGGIRTSLNLREWRRIVGVPRRSFVARVLENDLVHKNLRFAIEEPGTTNTTQVRYEAVVPYTAMHRLARLVPQGREFASPADELLWRRQHVRYPVYKQFFHPLDRFVAVELLALIGGNDMVLTFTWQIPGIGASWFVPLPTGFTEDGDYTVVATYNTLVGSPAHLSVPDAGRQATQFNLLSSATLQAGSTIDFSLKHR